MTETAEQIQAAFSRRFGEIHQGIVAVQEDVRSGYGDWPVDETLAYVDEEYDQADAKYAEAVAERNAAFEERATVLRGQLFGAPTGSAGPAFTNALMRAQEADDDQLLALANLAATTGDKTLGRAALAVATERGNAALALAYVKSDPEVAAAFMELGNMPGKDECERAAAFKFPRPSLDSLRPTAQQVMAAEHAKRVQGYENARRAVGGG